IAAALTNSVPGRSAPEWRSTPTCKERSLSLTGAESVLAPRHSWLRAKDTNSLTCTLLSTNNDVVAVELQSVRSSRIEQFRKTGASLCLSLRRTKRARLDAAPRSCSLILAKAGINVRDLRGGGLSIMRKVSLGAIIERGW